MRFSSRLGFLLLCLSFVVPVLRAALVPDPALVTGRLDNGVRYVFLPWNEPPDRLSLQLLVESGSLQERDDQRGLAHFLEHMAFNGTKHFSAGEMVEYFQRLGMAFGADTNAHTWWNETVYKLELPRHDPALLKDAFTLLRDYADGMTLGEAELDKERGVILSELRDRDTPAYRDYVRQLEYLFPDSLIPRRLTIGQPEVIRTAPRQVFVDYYTQHYTADRLVVVAVGALKPEDFLALVETHFGSLPKVAQPVADPDLGAVPARGVVAGLNRDPELPKTQVEVMALQALGPQPDTLESRVDELAVGLAQAIIGRRFDILAKAQEAPILSAGAYSHHFLEHARLSGVSADVRATAWEPALKLITTELERALRHGFTAAELAEAKANVRTALENAVREAPSRKSRELAASLVSAVHDDTVFTSPAQDLELLGPALESLDLAQVHAAFKARWVSVDRLLWVSGPNEVTGGESAVIQAYNAAHAAEIAPPAEAKAEAFAYTEFGPAGKVVTEQVHEDLGITQWTFANQVRVSVKPTDFEKGVIRVACRFGAGTLNLPADQPGLALLTEAIFVASGLEKHSADDLQRILAGRTVGAEFEVGPESFALTGATRPEDLLLQLQLLCAQLTAPGWRPEGEALAKRSLPPLYAQLAQTDKGTLRNQAERYLASGDARFGFPAESEIMARTTEEARAWLTPALRSGYLELALVGDLGDLASLQQTLAQTFGALPERAAQPEDYPSARRVAFPQGGADQTFTFKSAIPKALALVHWGTTDRSDINTVRRLSLLADILDDRMRVRIREELGEAYSPYAYNLSSDTYTGYGYLRALAGVEPGKVGHMVEILRELGATLAEQGATQDELVRALEPARNAIKEQRRNNRYWLANVCLGSHARPQQLDWARSFEAFWDSVKIEEINALAAQYLKSERTVTVRVVPE